MNFICVLVFIFLSSNMVDGIIDELVLSWFSRECVCNWSKPFLLGVTDRTIVYVEKNSISQIDFHQGRLIDRKSKLRSDAGFLDGYFSGCLIKLTDTFFYVIIYQNQILNLTSDFFSEPTSFR